eukprot:TRINITY_DN3955_c0_g1_i1.p1 TRINITY_DN3955_c0_g1~~TRINITY_DN3955_c0_g1_i1.p1  ORF type:complete len:548 (-),score=126.74 TRINITY_DN3955_c0_g1_i1:117-1760(-)
MNAKDRCKNLLSGIFNYNIGMLFLLLLVTIVIIMGNILLSVLNALIIGDTKTTITKTNVATMMFTSLLCRMAGKFIAGSLVDSFNPKAILIISILAKEGFLILFGLSSDYIFLILFWSIQDFFWAPIWPALVKIVANWFDQSTISEALAILSQSFLIGESITRGIEGLLILKGFGWRTIVISTSLCGIFSTVLVFLLVKIGPHDKRCIVPFKWLVGQHKVTGHNHNPLQHDEIVLQPIGNNANQNTKIEHQNENKNENKNENNKINNILKEDNKNLTMDDSSDKKDPSETKKDTNDKSDTLETNKGDEASKVDQIQDHHDDLIPETPKKKMSLKEFCMSTYVPLFVDRTFWIIFFSYTLMSVVNFTFYIWTPQFLLSLGASAGKAALGSMFFPAFGGIGTIVVGILYDRFKSDFSKDILIASFFSIAASLVFLFWLLTVKQILTMNMCLFFLALFGFFFNAIYYLPSGVLSLRFGTKLCGTASSLMDVGAAFSGSFSGFMSLLAGPNNDQWARVFFVCLLFSVGSLLVLGVLILSDRAKERKNVVKL